MREPNQKDDKNFCFYHEYCRVYLANTVLLTQMRQLFNERIDLMNRFDRLRKRGQQISQGKCSRGQGKKRHRRTAHQIDRHYRCPIIQCQKAYGSQGSLNMHIKRKHQEYYVKNNLENLQHQQYSESSL